MKKQIIKPEKYYGKSMEMNLAFILLKIMKIH